MHHDDRIGFLLLLILTILFLIGWLLVATGCSAHGAGCISLGYDDCGSYNTPARRTHHYSYTYPPYYVPGYFIYVGSPLNIHSHKHHRPRKR